MELDQGSTSSNQKTTHFGKLFVGQVPAVCTEEMLTPLFAPYGTLIEIKVMRDGSGRSKGCAWVRYESQAMAQAAIDALHEKHTIPPQTNTLQVRYAHSAPGGAGGAVGGGGGGGAQRPQGQRRPGGQGSRGDYDQANAMQGYGGMGMPPPPPPAPGAPQQNNPYAMPWAAPASSFGGSFGSAQASFAQVQWPQYQTSQRMPMSPPGLSVFIGNLPPTLGTDELRSIIANRVPNANLTALNIHRDRRFGFATFDTHPAAVDAAQALNNMDVHDRKIRAEITQNQPKQAPRGPPRPEGPSYYVQGGYMPDGGQGGYGQDGQWN